MSIDVEATWDIRFEVAADSKTNLLQDIWEMMRDNFPENERPQEIDGLKKQMDDKEYFVVVGIANERPAFFNACRILRKDLLIMEHLAVQKSMQKKGLGTLFMKKFLTEYYDQKEFKIVAEIEIPDDFEGNKKAVVAGRMRWYERLGFFVHKDDIHTFPAYNEPDNIEKRVRTFLIHYKVPFKTSEEFQDTSDTIIRAIFGEKYVLKRKK